MAFFLAFASCLKPNPPFGQELLFSWPVFE